MVWGFIWRFVVYGFVLAGVGTFLVGFVFKAAGGDMVTAHTVGMVVQGVALVLAATGAYFEAKDARPA